MPAEPVAPIAAISPLPPLAGEGWDGGAFPEAASAPFSPAANHNVTAVADAALPASFNRYPSPHHNEGSTAA